jgi:HAD superfamily hydrolase (TIGR01509 family)
MSRVRAVLFDIDGTLLDSNDAHAHAWLDALRGHGMNLPFDLVRSKIGMGGDKLLREIADIDHESLEGRSITERRIALLKGHYMADLGPFAGARVLVDRLRSRGLLCAAVTSSKAIDAADLLREAGVADLMDHVITADDADASKPDPDLVEVALERIGVAAEEAVLVGDTPYDVEAGQRAGVAVIAFRCGGWKDKDLAGAIAIYDGPADLSSHLDESALVLGIESSDMPRLSRRRAAMGGGL